ncbi:hypothetical protein [Streptomyces sp. NPDC087859]|uniref:hypothetical protein n=1 Tax=Streptomyces sp. NPDC087859 TaxID=3365812 RepID=UPI0037F8F8E6
MPVSAAHRVGGAFARQEVLAVWPDPWAVVAESDRAQWDYVPLERVGPLSFGMSPQEAAIAMEAGGYASDSAAEIARFARLQQLRTRFRGVGTPPYSSCERHRPRW